MKNTGIGWTDDTRNVVEGCTEVDEECERCYAKGVAARFSGYEKLLGPDDEPLDEIDPERPMHYHGLAKFSEKRRLPQWTGKVALRPDELNAMFWSLLNTPTMRRQFLCSMGDLGHAEVPDSYLDEIFARIALLEANRPGKTPHVFQMVTKRPERMAAYTRAPQVEKRIAVAAQRFVADHARSSRRGARRLRAPDFFDWPLRGVHLITSAGRQASVDVRVPAILGARAVVRGVSCEPMLTRVDFARHLEGMGWLILGGESDRVAPRPADTEWFLEAIEAARAAGVPVFMKQLGSALAAQRRLMDRKGANVEEWEPALQVQQYPPLPRAA